MTDAELRDLLLRLPLSSRDVLRRAARADQPERDELAHRLLRQSGGEVPADLIDSLSLDPQARQQVVRVLGWIETEA